MQRKSLNVYTSYVLAFHSLKILIDLINMNKLFNKLECQQKSFLSKKFQSDRADWKWEK